MERRPMAPGGAVVGTIMVSMMLAACAEGGTLVAVVNDDAAALTITVAGGGVGAMPAPNPIQLEVGDSVSLRALVTNALGFAVQTGSVSWSSSDAAVAQVSSGGVLRAVGPGTAGILASSGGVSAGVSAAVADTVTAFPAPPAG